MRAGIEQSEELLLARADLGCRRACLVSESLGILIGDCKHGALLGLGF